MTRLLSLQARWQSWGAQKQIPTVACLFFVLLTLLRIHGFSLNSWSGHLDVPSINVLGTSQSIRSDDWIVQIPAILSQTTVQSNFSSESTLFGLEKTNVRVISPIPSWSWENLFRPHFWGYYLFGADFGLAWHWNFRLLLLFVSSFLLIFEWSGGDLELSLLSAVCILYSGFFQYWALCMEPIGGWTLMSLWAIKRLQSRPSFFLRAWLAYSFLGLGFGCLYPAFQVPLAWIIIFLTAGEALQLLYRDQKKKQEVWYWLASVALAGFVSLLIFVTFLYQNRSTLEIIAHTSYPGMRFSLGGGLTLAKLLPTNFNIFSKTIDWSSLANICEASGFFIFFPLLALLFAWLQPKARKDFRLWSLFALLALFHLRNFFSFGHSFNHLSGLFLVPENRSLAGFGLGDLLLTLFCVSFSARAKLKSAAKKQQVVWGLSFTILYWLVLALTVHKALPEFYLWHRVLPSAALLIVLSYLFLTNRVRPFLRLLALTTFLTTCWFNPIARGGPDKFRTSPVAEVIHKTEAAVLARHKACGYWLSYGNIILSSAFRIFGVPSIGGVQFYPQFLFWQRLDPEQKYFEKYNRYAHIVFEVPSSVDSPIEIDNPHPDVIRVYAHPDDAKLLSLPIGCLMLPKSFSGGLQQWTQIDQTKDYKIYERKLSFVR